MKKSVTIEIDCCEACGADATYSAKCLGCGKAFCYECKPRHGISYAHGVHVEGSGDGYYCVACDEVARKTRDPLHAAYLSIRSLRDEARGFDEQWTSRRKAAEARLKQLQTSRPQTEGES